MIIITIIPWSETSGVLWCGQQRIGKLGCNIPLFLQSCSMCPSAAQEEPQDSCGHLCGIQWLFLVLSPSVNWMWTLGLRKIVVPNIGGLYLVSFLCWVWRVKLWQMFPFLWKIVSAHANPEAGCAFGKWSWKGSKAQDVLLLNVVGFWRRDPQRVDKGCLWCFVKIKTRNWVNLLNKCLLWCCFRCFSFPTSQKLLV